MRNIYFTITLFGCIATDVFTKYIAETFLETEIHLIDWFLSLEKIYNTGIAFSIPVPSFFLKILTVSLIFWIIVYYFYERKNERKGLYDIGFACIIGWAIGNAIERIFVWYVVDFISVRYFSVFNFADICITVWAWILLFHFSKKWTLLSKK